MKAKVFFFAQKVSGAFLTQVDKVQISTDNRKRSLHNLPLSPLSEQIERLWVACVYKGGG